MDVWGTIALILIALYWVPKMCRAFREGWDEEDADQREKADSSK